MKYCSNWNSNDKNLMHYMKWWRQGIQSYIMFILGKFLLFQMIKMLHNTQNIVFISSAHVTGPHRPFLSPGIKCLNIFWIVVFNKTGNIFVSLGRTVTIPTFTVTPLVVVVVLVVVLVVFVVLVVVVIVVAVVVAAAVVICF